MRPNAVHLLGAGCGAGCSAQARAAAGTPHQRWDHHPRCAARRGGKVAAGGARCTTAPLPRGPSGAGPGTVRALGTDGARLPLPHVLRVRECYFITGTQTRVVLPHRADLRLDGRASRALGHHLCERGSCCVFHCHRPSCWPASVRRQRLRACDTNSATTSASSARRSCIIFLQPADRLPTAAQGGVATPPPLVRTPHCRVHRPKPQRACSPARWPGGRCAAGLPVQVLYVTKFLIQS